MAFLFDGVDDRLAFTTLSTALRNLPTGAFTAAILMSRSSWTGGSDGWDIGWVLNDTPGPPFAVRAGFEWQSSTILSQQDNGANHNWTHGLGTLTSIPLLCVLSKGAGTVAPQWSIKNMNTSAWTHGTASTNGQNDVAVPSTGGLVFGGYPGSAWTEFLAGFVGVFAAWAGVAMDQTQRMACGTNNKSSDLANHSVGAPVSLIEFTQASPVDLKGGAGSISVNSAPSLDNATTLGWTYDGLGASPTGRRAGQGRSGQGRSNLFVGSDTTPPGNINVTTVTASKISRVAGKDSTNVTFTADEAFVEYMIRKVSSAGDGRTLGTLIEQSTISATTLSSLILGEAALVAYYRLAETTGLVADDASVNNRDGTIVLGSTSAGIDYAVSGATGDGNKAIHFQGLSTGGWATFGDAALGTDLQDNCAIEFFARQDGATQSVFMRDATSASGWYPLATSGGSILSYRVGGTSFNTTTPVAAFQDTNWHHFVLNKNGTTTELWMDGVQIHTANTAPANPAIALPWYIGKNGIVAASPIETGFDELAFYNAPLSSGSIAAHYAARSASSGGPTQYTVNLTDDEVIAAAAGEGTNLIKVFVKDAAGNWSS